MLRRTPIHARSAARLIAIFAILLGAGAPAVAGQADQPAAAPGLPVPSPNTPALSGLPAAPQTTDATSDVQMVLLPWSDPSIRIPPPEQFRAAGAAAADAATFQITFLAAGTPDPQNAARTCLNWDASAKAAFSYAASIWSSAISSPVPIRINTCWTDMGSTSILGSSSSYLLGLTSGNVTSLYSYALGDKLLGYDADTGKPDSSITYNSTFAWYFGIDGKPASSQVDFVSVVLHELGHSLNFAGAMSYGAARCTASNYGCWGLGSGYPDIYDRFVQNGSGQYLIDTTKFGNPSAALGTQLTSGNIYFSGYNAYLANANGPVKIYAPPTWAAGSSYSHLDYDAFRSTPNRLMVYAIPLGASIHDPGAVTMGILKDLGWAPTVGINDVSVTEGNSGATNVNFTVSLSHAVSWPVSVNWATVAGTASAGVDYVSAGGTATIAVGAIAQTITVQANGDTAFEPDETFYVNLTNAPGAFSFVDNQGLGAILNDDPPPTPQVSASISGSTFVLAWPFASADITYRVYRSTSPYFGPDTTQPLPAENYCTAGASCKYQATLASTDPNYFYVVRATSSGRNSDSNRSSSFRFSLAVQ